MIIIKRIIYNKEPYYELVDFEGYYVSRKGILISDYVVGGRGKRDLNNPHIVKYKTDKDGYCEVCLSKNTKHYRRRVHRLVAKQFLNDYSDNLEVNHIDGVRDNNSLENLEMLTGQENVQHSWDTEIRIKASCAKELVCYIDKQIHKRYLSMQQCSDDLKISKTYIREVIEHKPPRYSRCYIEKYSNERYLVYFNGDVIKEFASRKEIAQEYGKALNTLSYKINNKNDLIYKTHKFIQL